MTKSKTKAPEYEWFKFFPILFDDGTRLFSEAQVGAYVRFLILQWKTGGLPIDPRKLDSITKLRGHKLEQVLEKFEVDETDKLLKNRFLKELMTELKDVSDQNSAAGKKSAAKRWGKNNEDVTPVITPVKQPLQPPLNERCNRIENRDKESIDTVVTKVTTTPIIKSISTKEKKARAHLFRESEYFDLTKLKQAMEGTKYEGFRTEYYHEAMLNWSDNDNRRTDWLATCKNWMLRDLKDNKAALKSTTKIIQDGNDIDWDSYGAKFGS